MASPQSKAGDFYGPVPEIAAAALCSLVLFGDLPGVAPQTHHQNAFLPVNGANRARDPLDVLFAGLDDFCIGKPGQSSATGIRENHGSPESNDKLGR